MNSCAGGADLPDFESGPFNHLGTSPWIGKQGLLYHEPGGLSIPGSRKIAGFPRIRRWRGVKFCTVNGIPQTSLYALRHALVSVGKTLAEGERKSLVGHSRSMDTFGVYGHELPGESASTAEDVNRIFTDLLKSVL